ncbi:hypothetical protein Q3G72_020969 [Acer saccharum]|nr:hypothetical protein Q3G72_020969 [Acer saccharum]
MLQQPKSGDVQPNVSPSSQQQAESGGVQIQPNVSPSLQQPAKSGGVQVQPNVSPSLQQPAESRGVQVQPNANPSLKKPAKRIDFFLRPPNHGNNMSINGLPAGNQGESAHQPPLSEAKIAAVEFWEGRNHSHYRQLNLAAMKESTEDSTQVLGRFKRLFWKVITQLAPPIKIVGDTKLKNKWAALQMQRELQWFKEVEKIIKFPVLRDKKNEEDKTANDELEARASGIFTCMVSNNDNNNKDNDNDEDYEVDENENRNISSKVLRAQIIYNVTLG